jgi:acyl-CoA dehydrogenase
MRLAYDAASVERKIRDAVKRRALPRAHPATLVPAAVEAGVITSEEAHLLERAEAARADVVAVDAFDLEDYFRSAVDPSAIHGDGAATSLPAVAEESAEESESDPEAGAVAYGAAVVPGDSAGEGREQG